MRLEGERETCTQREELLFPAEGLDQAKRPGKAGIGTVRPGDAGNTRAGKVQSPGTEAQSTRGREELRAGRKDRLSACRDSNTSQPKWGSMGQRCGGAVSPQACHHQAGSRSSCFGEANTRRQLLAGTQIADVLVLPQMTAESENARSLGPIPLGQREKQATARGSLQQGPPLPRNVTSALIGSQCKHKSPIRQEVDVVCRAFIIHSRCLGENAK